MRLRCDIESREFEVEDDTEQYDEWMTILKGLKHLDSSVSVVSSWEKSRFLWSQQILDEIPTWLSVQKSSFKKPAVFHDESMCDDDCKHKTCEPDSKTCDETFREMSKEETKESFFYPGQDTPTAKQQFVLDILDSHDKQSSKGLNIKPLRMLVMGTAGSGKSFLIKRLQATSSGLSLCVRHNRSCRCVDRRLDVAFPS